MNGTAGISDPWTATGNIHEPIWMHPAWPKLFSAAAQRTHLGSNAVNSFPAQGVRLMLEVIDKGSSSESHPAPLLFVHGAWHAAWCWDEHFLDFFADKGHRALAVSLRGHGGSPAQKRMQRCSIADFVTDVESVANSLPTRPVVIGHSMGGFVVQKYLETHDAPAGVLVASVSTRGAGGFLLRGMKRHPWHGIRSTVTTRSLHGYNTPKLAREYFYSPHTPEPHVVRYAARLEEEFAGRITLDMVQLDLPKPERSRRRSWSWVLNPTAASHRRKSARPRLLTAPKQKSSRTWVTT